MKKNITIYVFGNPLLGFDNLPFKLASKLKKNFPEINFVIKDPNENIKPINKELILIDTVVGLNKVKIINNMEKIKIDNRYSPHDLDLGLNLKILYKIGKLKKVTIFGIPPNINIKEALAQLTPLLKKYCG